MANSNDENWEDVAEAAPTKVGFDTFGDVFIGIYKGHETITDPTPDPETGELNTWERYYFMGVSPAELAGEHCAVDPGVSLREALEKCEVGKEIRMEYVKDVPLKDKKKAPMRSFDVKQRTPRTTK